MENHRLVEMKPYDPQIFNRLYSETKPLREKIMNGISYHQLGITRDILSSWLDDKFIFVFNKYVEYEEEIIKAHIIRALTFFKTKIISKIYRNNIYSDIKRIDDNPCYEDICDTDDTDYLDLIKSIKSYLNKILSPNAYDLFLLELYPPLYITSKMEKTSKKIPTELILEYFQLDNTEENYKFISLLRKEIKRGINKTREYIYSLT